METFGVWFWPALSGVLAVLLAWSLLARRREVAVLPSRPLLVEAEDALKEIYKLQRAGEVVQIGDLARTMGISEPMAEEIAKGLVSSGWASEDARGIRLTKQGQERAQELIRIHRLWERYLVDREGMPLEAVHAEAHRREHETTPEQAAKLDVELGHPAWDPHGDIIPDAGRQVPPPAGSPLAACTPGGRLRILHVEDEPPALFAQLIAMGLKPGVEVEVVESEPRRLRVRVGSDFLSLATAAAERVHAVLVPILPIPLGELPVGSRARVAEVKGSGKRQRRMLDMGLVPGAEVTVIRKAPLGDPIEYRIKGTAVALRRKDADAVFVEELRDG